MRIRKFALWMMGIGGFAAGAYSISQFGGEAGGQRFGSGGNPSAVSKLIIPPAYSTGSPVRVNGDWASLNTTANLAAGAGTTTRQLFDFNNTNCIRQTGYITQAKIYIGNTTAWDTVAVTLVHRRIGKRWDHKGFVFKLPRTAASVGVNTITGLNKYAEEGWTYTATIIKQSADTPASLLAIPADATSSRLAAVLNTSLVQSSFDWYNAPQVGANNLQVEFYMQEKPRIIAHGYSRMEGHDIHHSFAHQLAAATDTAFTIYNFNDNWLSYFCKTIRPGTSYQNAGIGGQKAIDIQARFSFDCASRRPRVAVIQMGGQVPGDLDRPLSIVYNAVSAVLDTCDARDIIPLVVALGPMTGRTDAEMAHADSLDTALRRLCATHAAGARFLYVEVAMGKNRAAGPIGNVWDIKTSPAYDDGDGLHLTIAGQQAFANAINAALTFDPTP